MNPSQGQPSQGQSSQGGRVKILHPVFLSISTDSRKGPQGPESGDEDFVTDSSKKLPKLNRAPKTENKEK